MAVIKINVEELRRQSQALDAKIQELTDLNRSLELLLSRMNDSWEGEASVSYINMMRNYKKQTDQMVGVLKEFKSYTKQAADKFEAEDRSAASRLRGSF